MTRAVEAPRPVGNLWRVVTGNAGRLALAVGVVVAIFAGVLPRIANYGQAWDLARSLTGVETALLAVVGAVNLMSYAPLWVAAMP